MKIQAHKLLSIFDYFLIKLLQLKYDNFQSDLIWELGFADAVKARLGHTRLGWALIQ